MNMIQNRSISVLYGSQTGTAQDIAERLGRDATRRHFNIVVNCLDDYTSLSLIHEKIAIFVCSTTGHGDIPDNMKKFWKFLMRRCLPLSSLSGLFFAVIGLGDSSYPRYNVVAKKLYKRLVQLSAAPLIPLALGDDQHELGPDATIEPSVEQLWSFILEKFPLPDGLSCLPHDVLLPPKYQVVFEKEQAFEHQSLKTRFFHECEHVVKLLSNERVTSSDHFQDVRLISFDISSSDIKYKSGDVLILHPDNSPETVLEFMNFMQLNPHDTVTISPIVSDGELPLCLSRPRTIEELVTSYFDINSVPRRYFFEVLSYYAVDENEKEKLDELASNQGQEERFDYCNRVRRTILETLKDFPMTSARIPFAYIFDIIPIIQPRSFSIASSPLKHETIQLIVAVVRYKTKIRKPRLGLCSNWLANLSPEKSDIWLSVDVGIGTFNLRTVDHVPVICIGPGTGVAPLRSYIHDRHSRGYKDITLFFGCRNREKDFYFKQEWTSLQNCGVMNLFVACSRDQEDKFYVQHLIREQASHVWALMSEMNATILVAGNAKRMPGDVREAIQSIVQDAGGLSAGEAENYIVDLEKKGRYQVEAWS